MLLALLALKAGAQSVPAPSNQAPEATPAAPAASQPTPAQVAEALSDRERESLTFTRYDLDVHLRPAESKLSAVARVQLRNDGGVPLSRVALELSSTLHWEGVSERRPGGPPVKLKFEQHQLDTDTDHTGAETEAVMQLDHSLAPGATMDLTLMYSGTIDTSSGRLTRSGAPAADAERADWDRIGENGTFLRGFGEVLWYPVSAPQVFLGDGAHLAEAMGRQRQRQSAAIAQLRLQVEYSGKAPATAFFCGRMQALRPLEEEAGADQSNPSGIAIGEFAGLPLGFASPSLFVAQTAPKLEGRTVGIVTDDAGGGADRVEGAATASKPLVTEWLGPLRERQPILLDHIGQPFAQGAFLVETTDDAANSFAMVHLLSHAWFASDEVWLDEGVAQFLPILAIERERGRQAAMAQLEDQRPALALAESNAGDGGEALVTASREVFFRNKAVAVLWMLRELVGEVAMKKALVELRSQPVTNRGAKAFEASLEAKSGKDLAWFFQDWVLADKGLPDLSIVSAAARANPGRQGVG